MVLRFELLQALRGQHVLDLARADAKGQRAKRTVRGSVAVAADDRTARLSDPEFRTDHVHDALVLAVHVEQVDAGFFAVLRQRLKLCGGSQHRASAESRFFVETE